jgi:nucleotide-binding universal stress UspA family protein
MNKHPLYLVPFDFTEVSQNAAELALQFAKKNSGTVYLLNIVSAKKEKHHTRTKLQHYTEKFGEDSTYFTHNCLHGDIFDNISKATELLRPNLVILGTHGAKGFRKFLGSHMDKIIANSSSPLLIVQSKCNFEDLDKIVMPFNFSKESLQITSFAANMAKNFDATIHLLPHHGSNEIETAQVTTNKVIAQRFFDDHGVKHEIHDLNGSGSFEEQLVAFSKNKNADVIAIAYENSNFLGTTNFFMNHVIENSEKIPVLTYSSEELSQTYY